MRIASYVNSKSKHYKFDVEHKCDLDTALKIYGLGQQGFLGNNKAEEPPFYEVRDHMMWKAWEDEKGKSKVTARKEFVTLSQ